MRLAWHLRHVHGCDATPRSERTRPCDGASDVSGPVLRDAGNWRSACSTVACLRGSSGEMVLIGFAVAYACFAVHAQCYKNGAASRQLINERYCDGDWTQFSHSVASTAPGAEGFMNATFPLAGNRTMSQGFGFKFPSARHDMHALKPRRNCPDAAGTVHVLRTRRGSVREPSG